MGISILTITYITKREQANVFVSLDVYIRRYAYWINNGPAMQNTNSRCENQVNERICAVQKAKANAKLKQNAKVLVLANGPAIPVAENDKSKANRPT
jgi:hypothetical protein